jgi:hypothetical protein
VSAVAQPRLLAPGLVVQPGILDGHAGCRGQRGHHRLVLIVEVGAAALLGQVQVPEHRVADSHRHAEERLHRRVARREAERPGMGGHVGQPQRHGIGDQLAEQPPPLRPVVNRRDLARVQADGHELGQPARVADHAQRPVLGVHQRHRGLDDLPEHHVELEVAADGHDRVQQRVHPVGGRLLSGNETHLIRESPAHNYQARPDGGRRPGPGATTRNPVIRLAWMAMTWSCGPAGQAGSARR